jgi:hypothetical protein
MNYFGKDWVPFLFLPLDAVQNIRYSHHQSGCGVARAKSGDGSNGTVWGLGKKGSATAGLFCFKGMS